MSIKCTITCHVTIYIILNYLVYSRLLVSIKYGLSYKYEFVMEKKKGGGGGGANYEHARMY
jgi:hypothetical protein